MTSDYLLIVGIVVGVFSIPAIVSAISDGRSPRAAAIGILVSGGLIAAAVNTRPGGYTLADVPNAVLRVVADVTR